MRSGCFPPAAHVVALRPGLFDYFCETGEEWRLFSFFWKPSSFFFFFLAAPPIFTPLWTSFSLFLTRYTLHTCLNNLKYVVKKWHASKSQNSEITSRRILFSSSFRELEYCLNLKLMTGESHSEYHHILVHILEYSCSKILKIKSDNGVTARKWYADYLRFMIIS